MLDFYPIPGANNLGCKWRDVQKLHGDIYLNHLGYLQIIFSVGRCTITGGFGDVVLVIINYRLCCKDACYCSLSPTFFVSVNFN